MPSGKRAAENGMKRKLLVPFLSTLDRRTTAGRGAAIYFLVCVSDLSEKCGHFSVRCTRFAASPHNHIFSDLPPRGNAHTNNHQLCKRRGARHCLSAALLRDWSHHLRASSHLPAVVYCYFLRTASHQATATNSRSHNVEHQQEKGTAGNKDDRQPTPATSPRHNRHDGQNGHWQHQIHSPPPLLMFGTATGCGRFGRSADPRSWPLAIPRRDRAQRVV
jgi:hypothetical protein